MGLTVRIGLKRLFHWEKTDDAWLAALQTIVESGPIDRIRDLIPTPENPNRIIEALRTPDGVEIRQLAIHEADELLRDLLNLSTTFGDNVASFSWDDAESYAMDIQDLAAPFNTDADVMQMLTLPFEQPTRLVSIDRSLRLNWIADETRCNHVRAMHELARTHALLVHSA